MRTFKISFLISSVLFCGLLLPARAWDSGLIWSLLLGAMTAFAISMVRLWRVARRDRRLLDRADLEATPADGEVVAISGTIELEGEPLISPVRGERAAFYLYKVWHYERWRLHDSPGRKEVDDYAGWGASPCVVQGSKIRLRIGSFPMLHEFGDATLTPERHGARVEAFLASALFTSLPAGQMIEHIDVMDDRWDGNERVIRNYAKRKGKPIEGFREQSVPPGAQVCAIGVWSEAGQVLTNRGEQELFLYPGSVDKVREVVSSSGGCTLFLGVLLIAAVAALLVRLVG